MTHATWGRAVLLAAIVSHAYGRTPHLTARVEQSRFPTPSVGLLLFKQERLPEKVSVPTAQKPLEAVSAYVHVPTLTEPRRWRERLSNTFGGTTQLLRRALLSVAPGLVVEAAKHVYTALPSVVRRPIEVALSSLHALIIRAAAFAFGADEDTVNKALRWVGALVFMQIEQRAVKWAT